MIRFLLKYNILEGGTMKILLLGEFSSLHKYLKDGLKSIEDVDVVLYSQGDGWKKIGGSDKNIPTLTSRGIFGRIKFYIQYINFISELKGFDVVQLINTQIFPIGFSKYIIKRIQKKNKCISLVAAGEDYPLMQAYKRGAFNSYIYDFNKELVDLYDSNTMKVKKKISEELNIVQKADIIIPSLYEYAVGYTKTYSVIPFPINIDTIKYEQNVVNDKIVFFHGLNREATKGTKMIVEAMNILKEKYPTDVEIIIDGHMPFDEYVKIMKMTNVVVDQCLTYGYGINACIAMAQGKVVMAPCHIKTLESFGISNCPIIDIGPNVRDIYDKMEYLVLNKRLIKEIGIESRKYVEEIHNYKKIAYRYIDAWRSMQKF